MKKIISHCFVIVMIALSAKALSNDLAQAKRGNILRSLRAAKRYIPPDREDVAFVETSGGDLGAIHFRSDGVITIPLRIDRYFGDEQERKQQLKDGLLEPNFQLYMPAWDVDYFGGDGYWEPERDLVYFNGKALGYLNGDNEIWHFNKFEIPFDLVVFPESPGDIGNNLIEVYVDTANGGEDVWCTAIDWVALMIPAARPILLVHGWNSSSAAWTKMQKQIKKTCGIPTCTVDLGPSDSLRDNANFLSQCLNSTDGLKGLYGVEEFTILAHSKGGLDSRWYVNEKCNPYYCGDIFQVLQVATPNSGSRLADYLLDSSSLNYAQQAMLASFKFWSNLKISGIVCLTTEFASNMVKSCPMSRSLAPVKVVTGRVPDDKLREYGFNMLDIAKLSYDHYDFSPLSHQWGDGIVSVASAHSQVSVKPVSPLRGADFTHLKIIEQGADAVINTYAAEITAIKRPIYNPPARTRATRTLAMRGCVQDSEKTRSTIKENNEEGNFEEKPFTQRQAGIVEQGETQEHSFYVGKKQNITFIILGIAQETIVSLQSPSGKKYSNKDKNSLFEDSFFDGEESSVLTNIKWGQTAISLSSAEAGNYIISLKAENSDAEAGYQIFLQEEFTSYSFQCYLASKDVKLGDDFIMYCKAEIGNKTLLSDALKAYMQVEFVGEPELEFLGKVELRDDGIMPDEIANDGVFTASFPCNKTGIFSINASAKLSAPGGGTISTGDFFLANASKSRAKISSVKSINILVGEGKEMNDALKASCLVDIDIEGTYTVFGVLFDDEGKQIQCKSTKHISLNPGLHEIELLFSGEKIFAHGKNGPYYLRGLELIEWEENTQFPVIIDESTIEVETEAYDRFIFLHRPISLTGEGIDYAYDRNGDGICDTLHVELDILISETYAGHYSWSASLFGEDKQVLCIANGNDFLVAEASGYTKNKLIFEFPGEAIVKAGASGKFEVSCVSLWNGSLGNALHLPIQYKTSHYHTRQFLEELNILDVTEQVKLEFAEWVVNSQNGSLSSTVTMTNIAGKDAMPLELIFWFVLPSSENYRLLKIDGKTSEGKEYFDVTEVIEAKLPQIGNKDMKLDLGESVEFEVTIFSKDRSVPDPEIFSFWADPPVLQVLQLEHPFDLDNNCYIDDLEILIGIEKWQRQEVSDEVLLQGIKHWKSGKKLGGN